MIPSIEAIVDGVKDGSISPSQAVSWLHQHAEGAANDLRDHYAAMALQGILSNSEGVHASAEPMLSWLTNKSSATACDWLADRSFEIADAMMKRRAPIDTRK